jgi:hypothetical protein
MASTGGGASSTLSTDSPPFNPRGTTTAGSQSPSSMSSALLAPSSNHSHGNNISNMTNDNNGSISGSNGRSSTGSPVSNGGGEIGNGESFSNAIPKHTFQYDK